MYYEGKLRHIRDLFGKTHQLFCEYVVSLGHYQPASLFVQLAQTTFDEITDQTYYTLKEYVENADYLTTLPQYLQQSPVQRLENAT